MYGIARLDICAIPSVKAMQLPVSSGKSETLKQQIQCGDDFRPFFRKRSDGSFQKLTGNRGKTLRQHHHVLAFDFENL